MSAHPGVAATLRYAPIAAAAFAILGIGAAGCNEGGSLLRAKRIDNRFELVGGPVGMADVGDFLLENDQIRVAILGAHHSPGPGVFGGSLVDADLRRPFLPTVSGQGRDRFAETFPMANLLVPNPTEVEVTVLKDGSDGQEAAIRVEGEGDFFFEAISFLDTSADVLSLLFGDLKTQMRFRTDYMLAPGDRYVTIRTTLSLAPPASALTEECQAAIAGCELDCASGFKLGADGCLECACDDALPLDYYTGEAPIFRGILGDPLIPLGDPNQPTPELAAGVVAGDFVFFGNQNDIFGPGFGFDEEKAVFDAIFAGRDTFQQPLSFDFVAASGGDISYAYFTAGGDATPTRVNVPIFTSAATAFVIGAKNCLLNISDDAECDVVRGISFERYLAVGHGDIASAAEVVFEKRGTPTGQVEGSVRWARTGAPVPRARIFLLHDPEPGRAWASLDEVVEANRDATGTEAVLNAIFADRGIDPVPDGRFRAQVASGHYVAFARTEDGVSVSAPYPIEVKAGDTAVLAPVIEAPATLAYRVMDEAGRLLPCKVHLVSLDAQGRSLELDGTRRPYLGDGRFGNGIRHMEYSHTGQGEMSIEPGRYRLLISRGPEYSRYEEKDVTFAAGQQHEVDAVLHRELDTRGWASADMHLHAQPSFDSGMPLDLRVQTAVVEGLDLAVATDHDVLTDYTPAVRELGLEPWLQTAVGAEVSTLELGHYIGWPMKYDLLDQPDHGVHDWVCETGGEVLEGVRATAEPGREFLTILAHPRDGFIGYTDQLGVDPYTTDRKPALLNANNVLFRTATCGFDAMEVFNSKRLDLVRTPTVAEVATFNLCLGRVDGAADVAALDAACPELDGWPLVQCDDGQRFAECQHRHRSALAWAVTKQILVRTPEEQAALDAFAMTAEEGEELCVPAAFAALPPAEQAAQGIQPCTSYSGHVDDFFVFTEHGYHPTQVGSSDGHGAQREPGVPRTYFRSSAETPGHIDLDEAVRALRDGQAVATYGPFVDADVQGAGFGEVADGQGATEVPLRVRVETPSWFGVDRIEIYLNGRLFRALDVDSPVDRIVDYADVIEVPIPQDRDSWVVIIAMGLGDEHLLSPTVLSVPFGELQLPRVASLALAQLGPVAEAFLAPRPALPDWFPIPPLAFTNPIYVDVDGNGAYDAPLDAPNFCSRPCDPSAEAPDAACPAGQVCLEEGLCGLAILGTCEEKMFVPEATPDGDR